MTTNQRSAWVSGLALFSMFFGAGNVVFPLALGQTAGSAVGYGLAGLLSTAILFPLIGLMAMMLYKSNYDEFFGRIGHIPGRFVLLIVHLVVWVGVPRLITLSYAALQPYMPQLPLGLYSALVAALIFSLALRPRRIVGLLGSFLTPVLLCALVLIIAQGLFGPCAHAPLQESLAPTFVDGLKVGYNTLDLIAAFLFATLILKHFQRSAHPHHKIAKQFVKSAFIAASLLALVYSGMCLVAARHAQALSGVASEYLIGAVAHLVLGTWGGLISSLVVALACLTTAISLMAIFSDYTSKYWFVGRVGRTPCLLVSLIGAALLANLGFSGIVHLLGPVLEIAYPGLIVLSLLNIAHKLYEFRPVKIPVIATFGFAAVGHFI